MFRWYHHGVRGTDLGRDHRLPPATAYRYLTEGIEVLAASAPALHETLKQARDEEASHVMLEDTPVPTDRRV
jgi:hypothetical protein